MSYELVSSREQLPEEVDCLVVLGKQFGIGNNRFSLHNKPGFLSQESWWNIIASGILARSGNQPRDIVISGRSASFFPTAARLELIDAFDIIVPEGAWTESLRIRAIVRVMYPA